MRIKFTLSVIIAFFICQIQLSAQVEKVLYQYLTVKDSVSSIHLDFSDEFEVIPWHHENQIMVELTADLEHGSMDLLKLVIQDGRYKLVLDTDKMLIANLKFQNPKRSLLRNHNDICNEKIKLKIYVPDVFEKTGEKDYCRSSDTMIASNR